MNRLRPAEIIFLILLAATIFLAGEQRFITGILLAGWGGFALVRLLWIIEGARSKNTSPPRYLPAMILRRKMSAHDQAQNERAQSAMAGFMMLWLGVGLLYGLPHLLAAFLYESENLSQAQQFLTENFATQPAWRAAMIDLALQHLAAIWMIGAAAWGAYSLGTTHNGGKLFAGLLALGFLVTLAPLMGAPVHMHAPPLGVPILLLGLLVAVPLFRFARDMLRYEHRRIFAVAGMITLAALSIIYLAGYASLPLNVAGWALAAYLWARTSAPPPKKLRIRQ